MKCKKEHFSSVMYMVVMMNSWHSASGYDFKEEIISILLVISSTSDRSLSKSSSLFVIDRIRFLWQATMSIFLFQIRPCFNKLMNEN